MVLNIMASPGAGKTSFILATVRHLPTHVRVGVIEGDIASTIDAETMMAHGIPVVQINTGGNCHLDAPQIAAALPHLPLANLNLLFIENVGNLICPVGFDLGANAAIVIASVAEGHDKPYKYPAIFASADAIILNKSDLIDLCAFDVDYFCRGIRMVNTHAPLFIVSCRTDEGIAEWCAWLLERLPVD